MNGLYIPPICSSYRHLIMSASSIARNTHLRYAQIKLSRRRPTEGSRQAVFRRTDSTSQLVRCEAHPLLPKVPDTVVVLQQAPTNDIQALERINERLANFGVASEWSDAELAARDRQRELLALLQVEREGDLCRKRGNLRAGDAVGSRFSAKGLNIRRDLSVDGLGKSLIGIVAVNESMERTSVSAWGSTMLLVPLSKMKTRDVFSSDVDFPLTIMPEEVSCQNPEDASVREA